MTLNDNEFTSGEIMQYMKAAYGRQLNGNSFQHYMIKTWSQAGRIPDIYGGHKIEGYRVGAITIWMIEGLSRDILQHLDELRSQLKSKEIEVKEDRRQRPRRQRTAFYYQMLGKRNQSIMTREDSVLPFNWKQLGVKSTQLVDRGKSVKTKKKK